MITPSARLLALPGYRELMISLAALALAGWLCLALARRP